MMRSACLTRHCDTLTSCRVTKSFKVYFADADVARSPVVIVIRLGRSRLNVKQLWDDQHRFRQICRNVAWVRLPGRSTYALQQSVVVSLLFWHSSRGLNDVCPSLIHHNALSCFSREHPQTRLSTTSTPTCVECAFGSRHTRRNSATQVSKVCPSNACWQCGHHAAHPCGKVGQGCQANSGLPPLREASRYNFAMQPFLTASASQRATTLAPDEI